MQLLFIIDFDIIKGSYFTLSWLYSNYKDAFVAVITHCHYKYYNQIENLILNRDDKRAIERVEKNIFIYLFIC